MGNLTGSTGFKDSSYNAVSPRYSGSGAPRGGGGLMGSMQGGGPAMGFRGSRWLLVALSEDSVETEVNNNSGK